MPLEEAIPPTPLAHTRYSRRCGVASDGAVAQAVWLSVGRSRLTLLAHHPR